MNNPQLQRSDGASIPLRRGLAAAVLLLALALPACGPGEPTETGPPEQTAERTGGPPAKTGPAGPGEGETIDGSSIRGRTRDGVVLAVAEPLRPELAAALPPGFPDDIPLGNWLTISMVRQLGETDFVLSCFTSYRRDAVSEFFVMQMPQRGWKLVSSSSKPILSVFTFRKDERAVTVMVKKQVMNEDVEFDISYKVN